MTTLANLNNYIGKKKQITPIPYDIKLCLFYCIQSFRSFDQLCHYHGDEVTFNATLPWQVEGPKS